MARPTGAWMDRIKAALRPLRHPGNLVYAFGLDQKAWKRIRARQDRPYPKASDAAPPRETSRLPIRDSTKNTL